MKKMLVIAIVAFLLTPAFANAETTPKKGETQFHGYLDLLFFDDRGIGWSGSETTFLARAKLDVTHAVYDDILVRFKGEYVPSVHEYSRAYGKLKEREGNLEDTYIQFNNVLLGYGETIRLGVVKVPFGHFDTFAIEDRNRPISMSRWRGWDFGGRIDMSFSLFDLSFAVVNGEGTTGTDANSSKAVALRVSYSSGKEELYTETAEITNYPNPLLANPAGDFQWGVGLSGYVGNRYTTPIKVKDNHYALDFTTEYSRYALKGQLTYMEGFFTNKNLTEADFKQLLIDNQYSSAPTFDIETYPKGVSFFLELTAGISEKTMIGVMYENFDPDIESGTPVGRASKERFVIGTKHDFRPAVSGGIFYTVNNDPAFGKVGNIVQSDSWKGDNVFMAIVAVEF